MVMLSSDQKKRGDIPHSVKSHAREERNSGAVNVNEPLKVLLKNTLARATILSENSIQTRFGGDSLPTAIEQFDEPFANLRDEVTMQKDKSNTVSNTDHSVSGLPHFAMLESSDGFVHLAFDLTHDVGSFGLFEL